MAACLIAIGIILAGQVGAASDPYPSVPASTQPAPRQTTGSARGGTGTGTVSPPPPRSAAGQANESIAPLDNDLYGAPAQSGGAGDQGFPLIAPTNAGASQAAPPPSGYKVQNEAPINAPPSNQPEVGMKPSALMQLMLTPPRVSQLTGESVSLVEVVSGTSSRAEQTHRVEAYWDLCSSVADYYLGLREQEELQHLKSLVPRAGASLQEYETELGVRVATSLRAARASQLRLAGWMGRGTANLPVPSDMPHCGSYNCHYDKIFANRPSTEAQELATLLPQRYTELKSAATAVTRAEEWRNRVAETLNENSDGTGTLRALELLALRRRAFVQIGRDYNRRIARYSELATPGQLAPERLVGMLIKREGATAGRAPSPLGRASGAPPPTYANQGWSPAAGERPAATTQDPNVKPASGQLSLPPPPAPREERSLLVKPQ